MALQIQTTSGKVIGITENAEIVTWYNALMMAKASDSPLTVQGERIASWRWAPSVGDKTYEAPSEWRLLCK